jgi:hypothetical protein
VHVHRREPRVGAPSLALARPWLDAELARRDRRHARATARCPRANALQSARVRCARVDGRLRCTRPTSARPQGTQRPCSSAISPLENTFGFASEKTRADNAEWSAVLRTGCVSARQRGRRRARERRLVARCWDAAQGTARGAASGCDGERARR